MEPTRVSKKNFESMHQIVLGMSNQFLTTHLSRIVRCRALVGSHKVADGDYRECRQPANRQLSHPGSFARASLRSFEQSWLGVSRWVSRLLMTYLVL